MSETADKAQVEADTGFEELGIDPLLIGALQRLKLDAPTEIQRRAIPVILEGRDCLARATTGAGKTNAYLLPILQNVTPGEGLQALVIQPTRALALQLERNLHRFAPERAVRTAVAAGGREARSQPNPLAAGPDVLIATPRGAAELIRRHRQYDWSTVRMLIADEVDAILEERGPEQFRSVRRAFEHPHQTVLIAGELNESVRKLADEFLNEPEVIDVPPGPPRAVSARHAYFEVSGEDKFDALLSFCKQQTPKLAIVMTNSEKQAREVAHRLERARVSCRWIGARRPPRGEQRGKRAPRARSEVIVASDPAPRQLTTIPASHLLHYELPGDVDTYAQRLRQAPRLRRHGTIIAFVEPDERPLLAEIEERFHKPFEKLETPRKPERRSRERPQSRATAESPADQSQSERSAGRLSEVLSRDEDLDARGIKPVRRTLGSRFRSARRSRPLRRPES